jgi:hypothetical protein
VLTIFATPKAFRGRIATIQRNAITSWTTLHPRPEIILFGDEPGTAGICRELGLAHIPTLAGNEYGAPLLADLFESAQLLATQNLLCYVNADIILLSDFADALRHLLKVQDKFLMVGRRWDVRMDGLWDFDAPDWEKSLRNYVLHHGVQGPSPGNSDYFAFPRGLWASIPALALGRGWWDAWLIYSARRRGAAVIDASSALMAVHQVHDQSGYTHGLSQWRAELNLNYQVVGKEAARFCLFDATHLLTPAGLQRTRGIHYLVRRLDTLPVFYPRLAMPLRIPKLAIAGARALREKLALARDPVRRLGRLVHSKLPQNGVTAILGLADGSDTHEVEARRGLRLAHALLWGGIPVVVYDPEPSLMKKARHMLGGPVEFAASAEECVKHADVVVIAAPCEEFRHIATVLVGRRSPRCTVIDCCALLERELPREGIQYLSWGER